MPLPPSVDRPILPELFTVKDTAEYLHLHPDTVIKFLRAGRIRGAKVGHRWLVRSDDLAELAKFAKVPAVTEVGAA